MESDLIAVVAIWTLGVVATAIGIAFGVWTVFFRGRATDHIPGWNARSKDCPYSPSDLSMALNAFVESWGQAFGRAEEEKLDGMLNQRGLFGLLRFSIHFNQVKEKRYYILRWAGKSLKVAGHLVNRRTIMVAVLPDDPLGAIALFHELTHPALLHLHGAPDNNHAPPPGPWKDTHDALIASLKRSFASVLPVGATQEAIDHIAILNEPILPPSSPQGKPVDVAILCGTCARSTSEA